VHGNTEGLIATLNTVENIEYSIRVGCFVEVAKIDSYAVRHNSVEPATPLREP